MTSYGYDSTVVVTSKRTGVLCQKHRSKTSNARNGGSSPIKIPEFEYFSKIAKHLNETRWASFFEVMAKGSFWRGIKYVDSQILAKKKNTVKTHLVVVSGNMNIETDLEKDLQAYNDCKTFITENSSHLIQSEDEQNIEHEISHTPQKTGFESSVSKQVMFVETFSSLNCKKFNLNETIKQCLVSSIFAKLSNKALVPKSFVFGTDGFIQSINGLVINEAGYFFDDSVVSPEIKKKTKTSDSSQKQLKKQPFKCSKNLASCLLNN